MTEKVSVFGFEPVFDPGKGEWFCDISVDPDASYAPFLRLALCRVQPHAIAGEMLSEPVSTWSRIFPKRQANVVIEKVEGGRKVAQVEVRGHAYHDANMRTLGDPRLKRPTLTISLLRALADDLEEGWEPPDNPEGIPTVFQDLVPEFEDGEAVWRQTIVLPVVAKDQHLGLLLSEQGFMAADASPQENEEVRMSHRTFMCMIDLTTGEARGR